MEIQFKAKFIILSLMADIILLQEYHDMFKIIRCM